MSESNTLDSENGTTRKSYKDWLCYLVRQPNNALYCGVTNDLDKRFAAHCNGSGAKALRGKGPLVLVWQSEPMDKRSAMRLEWRIKKLNKAAKERLVAGGSGTETALLNPSD